MVVFSNCKINLGLHILNKRPDGFHNIETIFLPVPWKDVIEIEKSKKLSLDIFGRKVDGNIEDNFCIKAYNVLKKDFDLPPVNFCLLKNIPLGAGLGGGSGNAAFTLKLLNDFLGLGLSTPQLKNYASVIGSDCSFFIENKPALATSKGEVLEDISINLLNTNVVLIYPQIHIDTAWAYKTFSQKNLYSKHPALKELIKRDRSNWKEVITNDFEKVVFAEYPALKKIKQRLYEMGAYYASMSGSGSALFAFFEKPQNEKSLAAEFKLAAEDVFSFKY